MPKRVVHFEPMQKLSLAQLDEPARLQIPVSLDQMVLEGGKETRSSHRLRNGLWFLALLAISGAGALLARRRKAEPNTGELKTARLNDLTRLAGSWYEMARMPGKVDKQAYGMRVTFSIKGAQQLELAYSWHTGSFDGPFEEESHKLRIEDPRHLAKMKKRIVGELEIDYWLLEIGRHDDFIVLGTPSRQHLWILSRSPELSPARYEAIVLRMQQQGFDTSKLIRVPQTELAPRQSVPGAEASI